VTYLGEGFPTAGENVLMVGDTIVSVNGERLYYRDDFHMFIQLARNAGATEVDFVVRRDGSTIQLDRFQLGQREIRFNHIEATPTQSLRYSGYTAMNYVRIIRVSIAQIISGNFGVRDLYGPVGIVDEMNAIGQASPTFAAALANIANFTALIGVNLAVMNLLPLPALDGGRILFIGITWVIEKVTRRRLDPKYEGYIHTAAMVLLMGLMVFVLVNDVVRIANAR